MFIIFKEINNYLQYFLYFIFRPTNVIAIYVCSQYTMQGYDIFESKAELFWQDADSNTNLKTDHW